MPKTESIKCDNCGKELICDTSYPHVYALELKAIDVNRKSSGAVLCVYVHPPIAGNKHFCNKNCLGDYLNGI
jgi:hypothetical protein